MKKNEIKQKSVTGREPFNRRRIFFGIALILAAVIIGAIIIPQLANKNVVYDVIITSRSIEAGTVISRENFKSMLKTYQTTDESFAASGFQNADEIFGQFVMRDINQGSILKRTDVAKSMYVDTDKVPDGKELVGVGVGAIQTDIGFMPRAGDIIRIYGLKHDGTVKVNPKSGRLEPGVSSEAYEYELLQYLKIYSVLDGNGISIIESGAVPTNMVLICSNAQVKQLIEAQNAGNVYMSLMSSGDADEAKRLLEKQDRIVAAYEIRNALSDVIEKEPIAMSLTKFTFGNYDPLPGDYISIVYTEKKEYTELNDNGELEVKTKTELVYNDMLKCIKVSDVLNTKGVTVSLAEANADPDKLYPKVKTGHKICLELSEEQLKLLQEIEKGTQIFVTHFDGEEEDIILALEDVEVAIRHYRISQYEDEIAEIERKEAEERAAKEEEQRKALEEAEKGTESGDNE